MTLTIGGYIYVGTPLNTNNSELEPLRKNSLLSSKSQVKVKSIWKLETFLCEDGAYIYSSKMPLNVKVFAFDLYIQGKFFVYTYSKLNVDFLQIHHASILQFLYIQYNCVFPLDSSTAGVDLSSHSVLYGFS